MNSVNSGFSKLNPARNGGRIGSAGRVDPHQENLLRERQQLCKESRGVLVRERPKNQGATTVAILLPPRCDKPPGRMGIVRPVEHQLTASVGEPLESSRPGDPGQPRCDGFRGNLKAAGVQERQR